MNIKSLLLSFLLCFMVLTLGFGEAQAKPFPKHAKFLTQKEVKAIYQGKTWRWDIGGAYFAPDESFSAVSGRGKSLTTAAGWWSVSRHGRLCFIADWTDRKTTYRKVRSCYIHAKLRNQMYQSKVRSGNWYVIKSAPPKRDDMIRKIVRGNAVACAYVSAAKKLRPNSFSKKVAFLNNKRMCRISMKT
jgi:Protein of unknown function (DUF995)